MLPGPKFYRSELNLPFGGSEPALAYETIKVSPIMKS